MGVDVDAVDAKIQKLIRARGGDGLLGISRNFRIIDVDNSGALNKEEFNRAMQLFGAGLNQDEIDALFAKYDVDGGGTVSTDEYLRGIRGAISKTRKNIVRRIFATMDADRSGELTIDDLRGKYSAKDNPDVKSGKKTEDQVLEEFLAAFEGEGGEKGDGVITMDEWIDYYTGISSNIDNDDHFLLLMCRVWKFPYAPLSKVQNLVKLMQRKVKTIQKGHESEEKTLVKQFRQIDSDGSGEVDMGEFKKCMIRLGLFSEGSDPEDETAVELLFFLFDADASEALSYKEFATAVLHYEF